MSIINEALKKAEKKKERDIEEPVTPPLQPPAKEGLPPKKPKIKISKPAPEHRYALDNNKKVILLQTFSIIGAIILVSLGLSIMVKQNIKDTIDRSLGIPEKAKTPYQSLTVAAQEKNEAALPEPLERAYQQSPVNEPEQIPSTISTSEFVLTGIVHGEGAPMAIINGSVYVAGDRVGTATVLEISKDIVVMERNNERFELKVR